jgi:hypothetical protein
MPCSPLKVNHHRLGGIIASIFKVEEYARQGTSTKRVANRTLLAELLINITDISFLIRAHVLIGFCLAKCQAACQ